MRSSLLLVALALPPALLSQQSTHSTRGAATTTLPAFSGTWVLNPTRSKVVQRSNGESRAIIQYDGKTWHHIHTHQADEEGKPDAWQTTLIVDSPTPHVVQGEDITFRSRIQRVGTAMLLTETGTTLNGQKTTNSVRYTLEDGGKTLVETETAVGPLGKQVNIYVLEREGSGATGEHDKKVD
ncbi:hypothetical protein Terro_2747 [Terriglobus roseus DSM 18391]|uniref:Lipocalin-like domain-containing protein n=1 Tax=Terriglobus roseus (strain DSM 18391 / NRRL B-41598 / KBS 63) TaxID=926566 RepID=I3ZIB5_TERRK|nr:hypothetical protein [Terriglobus roseus]AFL88983.1 hypothetical protein Terro_2747 [Terriglobus roseus DSM 18391]